LGDYFEVAQALLDHGFAEQAALLAQVLKEAKVKDLESLPFQKLLVAIWTSYSLQLQEFGLAVAADYYRSKISRSMEGVLVS